jgi:hypothetical protein
VYLEAEAGPRRTRSPSVRAPLGLGHRDGLIDDERCPTRMLEQAHGTQLLGFVPTMYKPRRGDSRRWLNEFERLAAKTGARVFSPIGDLASLASFKLDAHPYCAARHGC